MLEDLTPPKNKTFFCKVEQLSVELDDIDSKIFLSAINNQAQWGARTLSNELRKRGVEIADTTIAKHRNKGCNCYRDN